MAGELYSVFGSGRYMPDAPECPEALKGKKIKLKATDGTIEVDAEVAYLSRKIAAVVASEGPDAEVPLPVNKQLLSKVVEYMTQYTEVQPSDLKIPLPSSNLSEAGASKFDAALVKGDKEPLFDLMYAGLALAVPGLAYLTSAQVATLTQEKAPDQIRKAFGLNNDLSAEDAEMLTGAYANALGKKRMRAEEGSLMAAAAIMSGLALAAERNGGLAGGPPAVDLKSAKQMCYRATVLEEPGMLPYSIPEVKADREVAFAAVKASEGYMLEHVADELKSDKELVLAAVKASDGKAFVFAADALKGDKAFVKEAIDVAGGALEGASDALRGDKSLILEAASNGKGSALKGASDALRSDPTFVKDCVAKDPSALSYAADDLLKDKDFLVSVAKMSGKALEFMPAKAKADVAIVNTAASTDGAAALPYAHAARKADFDGPSTATIVETDFKKNMGMALLAGLKKTDGAIDPQVVLATPIQKYVMFTALSTMTPNMGQSNYIAANAFLDKVPSFERPERDCIAMSWGTVGGMGMRYKAFGSQDFMNMTPDLLLSIDDCCKILNVVTTKMLDLEWMGANLFDEGSRFQMLQNSTSKREDATLWNIPRSSPVSPPEPKRTDDSLGAGEKKSESSTPLGGWAILAGAGSQATMASTVAPVEPFEGARVRLTGLSSKEDFTGTVLKIYEEGKCRVSLDGDKKGNALVKTALLEVIA